jgi:conjugal transfer/type IV secretion protein DotA/TraY
VVGGDSDSATRHITRWSYGSCGSFGFETVYADTGVKSADNSATSNLNVAYKAFHDKRAVATQEMIDTLRSRGFTPELQKALGEYFSKKSYSELASAGIAKSLEQGGITINAVGILMNDLGATWNSKVQQAAREIYNASASESKDALAKRIETYGFMVAGTYERELSKISGNTSRLSNAMPFTTIPNPGTSYIDAYRAAVDAIYLNRNLDSDELLAKGGADMSDGGDALSSLMNKIMPSMDVLQRKSHLSSDPVGEMISFGHTLLAFAQVLILGVLAAVSLSEGGAGNAVAAFFGAKGVAAGLQYLSQWISYFILILIVVGVLHAYILPMIPMIMVFVMGISWLVLFLEAAIAGVLWAFAFIRMDGQEFFDRHQSNGVSLLFNLFLRPAIGMLAFIGGIILLPTMLRALDLIWNDAFYAQAGSAWTFTGLFWLATNLVMYFWLQWHLTLRLFGLVPTIADRVGHWMGFSGGHGYNDGQETTAAVGAAVAAGTAVSKAPINPQVNLDAKKKRENAPPPPHEEGK